MEIKVLKEGVHQHVDYSDALLLDIVDPICSSVTLIRGEQNIIVDAGNMGFEEEIRENLLAEGLRPADIGWVVITHKHPDHFLGIHMYPDAFKVIDYGIHRHGRGVYYKDSDSIQIPGVRKIKTPGHTPEHITVIAECGGRTYVMAGDAIRHTMLEKGFANEQEKASAKRILSIADIVIPGHGPGIEGEMLQKFKQYVGVIENF